jgi:hypothetical protein
VENGYEILHMEFKESLQGRFIENNYKWVRKVVRFSRSQGCLLGKDGTEPICNFAFSCGNGKKNLG